MILHMHGNWGRTPFGSRSPRCGVLFPRLLAVRHMPWMKGIVVIRRSWVVERTFALIMKCRRLARDYEQLPRVAETLILIAASATLVR